MKGYKGFSHGMVCRGKQYQENTEFTEPEAKICESGMHFCPNPFDVWSFYPPTDENGNLNEFAEVEAMDDPQTDDDIKYCSRRLRIGAKLDLPGFIKASVDFIFEHVKSTDSNTGNYSAASVSGNESFAIATGQLSKVKGALGCWIAGAEWAEDDKGNWHPVDFKAVRVDGKEIKADTWYRLEEGKFIEVEEG